MKEAVKVYLEPEVHRALRLLAADTTGCSQSALASQIIESFLMEPVVLVPQPPTEGKTRMKSLKTKKKQEEQPQRVRYRNFHPTVLHTAALLPDDEDDQNGPSLADLTRPSTNPSSGRRS